MRKSGKSTHAVLAILSLVFIFGIRPCLAQESGQSPVKNSFRVEIGGSDFAALNYDAADSRPALLADGWSGGLALGSRFGAVPVRLELSCMSVARSMIDSAQLFYYRGFSGFKAALEAGYSFVISGMELDILAGPAVSVTEYTDTALMSAFLSGIIQPVFLMPAFEGSGFYFSAGIPIELMFRGSTLTMGLGAAVGFGFSL